MPVENSRPLEIGGCTFYIQGSDEPIMVRDIEVECRDEQFAEDVQYIRKSFQEPVEFTCEAEFNRNWTTVKCMDCGYEFPVTEWFVLMHGLSDWRCPRCALEAAIEDAKKRSNV